MTETNHYVKLACDIPDRYLISQSAMENKLSKLNTRKATGPDCHIPAWILKEYREFLSAPLTNIFDSTIISGTIPMQLKCSNIVKLAKCKHPRNIKTDETHFPDIHYQ